MTLHPLDLLSVQETNDVRDIVLKSHPKQIIYFRETYLQEPPKQDLIKYLAAEHSGQKPISIPRTALAQYDVIGSDGVPQFHESVINLNTQERVSHVVVPKKFHACLTM